MVLETRLMRTYLLLLVTLISANCSAVDNEITDQANLEGYDLVLRSSKGLCFLDSNIGDVSKSVGIKIKPPCYFLRQGDKEPQSFAYDDVGISSTIIMVGSPISKEKREKWNIEENKICGKSRQAILIKKSGLVITERVLEGGVICANMEADEKDFWYFAH